MPAWHATDAAADISYGHKKHEKTQKMSKVIIPIGLPAATSELLFVPFCVLRGQHQFQQLLM
jgi:hypothetical protein